MITMWAARMGLIGLAAGAWSLGWVPDLSWTQTPTASAERRLSRQTPRRQDFPRIFQGRWAYVAADCRASGSSAIRAAPILSVDAQGLRRGNWRLLATSITPKRETPRHIIVHASNTDGRTEWRSVEEFRLSDDGRTLEWRRQASEPSPGIRLYRCR